MPRKARPVTLSDEDLRTLTALARRHATPGRVRARARTLLLLHRGLTHDEVVEALDLAITTVYNIKRRYLSGGLDAALYDRPRSGRRRSARIPGEPADAAGAFYYLNADSHNL